MRISELLDRLGRAEFPSTLHLDGPSEPVKAAVLAELRHAWAKACPEAPLARVLRTAETSVEEILGAYQGTSLFTPRELILVLEIEDLGRSEKKVAGLAAGLGSPAGGSFLVLVESASETPPKKLEPVRSSCAARVTAEPPDRVGLLTWGARRLARERIQPEAGVLETIANACEGDPLAFFSELDKLCTWSGPDSTLRAQDVATLLRPVVGADLPEYLGAVANGKVDTASQRLTRMLAGGISEGTVLFALSNLVGGALGGWARERELSALMRRRVPAPALAIALDACYRAESAWKGGRADVVAVLEQATRDVAGAGAPGP